jgi:hypothetical protein
VVVTSLFCVMYGPVGSRSCTVLELERNSLDIEARCFTALDSRDNTEGLRAQIEFGKSNNRFRCSKPGNN